MPAKAKAYQLFFFTSIFGHTHIKSDCIDLVIPKETVYPVNDRNIAKKLG
jgi:hypothetical protein